MVMYKQPPTPTSLGQYGLNETDGKVTKGIAVTNSNYQLQIKLKLTTS